MGLFSSEAKVLLQESTSIKEVDENQLMLDEATDIILEGMDTDVKFHFNKELLQDQKQVKELCKVIEDDMTKPSVRNFLVNNFILIILSSITLPLSFIIPFFPLLFTYLTIDYSFKRHDSFIKKIDKSIDLLKDSSDKDAKKKIAALEDSKKILEDAKAKYKTLEGDKKKNLVGFVLGKTVRLY